MAKGYIHRPFFISFFISPKSMNLLKPSFEASVFMIVLFQSKKKKIRQSKIKTEKNWTFIKCWSTQFGMFLKNIFANKIWEPNMRTWNKHYRASFQFIRFHFAFINKDLQERIAAHCPEKLSIKILQGFCAKFSSEPYTQVISTFSSTVP